MPLGHWTVGRLGRESWCWWYPHICWLASPWLLDDISVFCCLNPLKSPWSLSKIPEILANAPDFAAAVAEPSPPVSSSWPGVYQQKWEKCNVNPEVINVNFRNKLAGLYLRSVLRNNCMQYAKYIKSNVRGILGWKNVCTANFETRPRFRLMFFHFSKVICSMYCFLFFCRQKHCQLLEKTNSMNL